MNLTFLKKYEYDWLARLISVKKSFSSSKSCAIVIRAFILRKSYAILRVVRTIDQTGSRSAMLVYAETSSTLTTCVSHFVRKKSFIQHVLYLCNPR